MNITIQIPQNWLSRLGVPDHMLLDQQHCLAVVKRALTSLLTPPLTPTLVEQSRQAPADGDAKPTSRFMFYLPDAEALLIRGLAEQLQITPGPMAKRLLAVVVNSAQAGAPSDAVAPKVDPDHRMSRINEAMGLNARYEQALFHDNILDSMLVKHSIGMVEGGTGIGKTRAMVDAAAAWVDAEKSTCAIAVPSLALVRQFAHEYKAQESVRNMPELQVVMGRREFVSEHVMHAFLSTTGQEWNTPEVRAWMANGFAPGDPPESGETPWQSHSLLQISPGFPIEEVTLDEVVQVSDRGYVAYRSQFEKFVRQDGNEPIMRPPMILLFTHAMLAQDLRRRVIVAGADPVYREVQKVFLEACRGVKGKKFDQNADDFAVLVSAQKELGLAFLEATEHKGLLPDYKGLLIDEAHQFDESMSRAVSDCLSLRSLLNLMIKFKAQGGKLHTGSVDSVEACVRSLSGSARVMDRTGLVNLEGDGQFRITPYLHDIAAVCQAISSPRDQSSERFLLAVKIKRAGKLIELALSDQGRRYAFLRHSPIRHLPQLMVSNAQSQTLINRLWSSIHGCALISATMYLQVGDGTHSGGFMASLLSLPSNRTSYYTPVHAPWVVATVGETFCVHGDPNLLPSFGTVNGQRVKDQDVYEQQETSWHHHVAHQIASVHRGAAGGVLVLCTSFDTVKAIAEKLTSAEYGFLPESIIQASSGLSLSAQAQAFMRSRHSGTQTLWLAVGNAWTGLDVGGHTPWAQLFGEELPASQDNVLTDLVIPRLPFRVNQSLSHLWRIRNSPSTQWDYLDAALRFKQGLGRLVRREGLPTNRRITVLDARLTTTTHVHRLVPFLQTLKPYRPKPLP